MFCKQKDRRSGGFTLVELIVVLAILTVLAAFLFPALNRYIEDAQRRRAEAHAVFLFRAAQTVLLTDSVNGRLPRELDVLEYLTDTVQKEVAELAGLQTYEILAAEVDEQFSLIAFVVETDGYRCYWLNSGGKVSWELEPADKE